MLLRTEKQQLLMRRYNIDNLMRKPSNNTLRTVSLENPRDLCFMVNDTDVALLSLLNRAIRVMGSEKITSSVNKYTYYGQFHDFQGLCPGTSNPKPYNCFYISFTYFWIHVFLYSFDRYSELLERPQLPDEVKAKYIANIKKSGNYLLDLINEVLEMARIENGKISMVIDSIPSADKDRITVQTVIEDNGIGMGIVKKYIDLMGGTVLVESEQGKGTKVTLTISHKLAERPVEKEECQEEEMNFAGTNILLVDDVMINLEIAKEILLKPGAR